MTPRLPLNWIIDREALDDGFPLRTAHIQVYVDVKVGAATLIALHGDGRERVASIAAIRPAVHDHAALIALVERSALRQGVVIDRSPAPLPS